MEYEHSPDMGNMPDLRKPIPDMNKGTPKTQTPGTQMPDTQMREKERDMLENRERIDMNEMTPNLENNVFPTHVSLAMAYVPYQPFENLFDNETALNRGTLFKALDLPFLGGKGGKK